MASDTLRIDTLSLMPGTLIIRFKDSPLSDSLYNIDYGSSTLIFKDAPDSLALEYRVLPFDLSKRYAHKDTSLITRPGQGPIKLYTAEQVLPEDYLTGSTIQKSGSISRGIQVGNAQNLSVNSTLNLQLSGKITEQYSVLASIADDNIPIQPQGNTQQLQDFDQVFIQVYDERTKLIAGDFQIKRPAGYFMNYAKRAQGAYVYSKSQDINGKKTFIETEVSASISKGRFGRNQIQGIEGNQGPYRLTGNDGELFIIVLAGTEQVFIDGKLLERGQDRDYVIDYNAAEIRFTARQAITKDRRIIVEFQYSDKRYARPMITTHLALEKEKIVYYLNVFSENDARNQPLQQEITADARQALTFAGDNVLAASINGIDSVGYSNSQVLYALRDSLGFDSILVFSTLSTEAFYQATFSYVGEGNGDYIQDEFSSNGRTYKWVIPVDDNGTLIHQGSFAPIQVLFTPRKRQMAVVGTHIKIRDGSSLKLEGAVSNNDLNTFSALDDNDNIGHAQWLIFDHLFGKINASDSTWKKGTRIAFEHTDPSFVAIERFRSVEFERNWNLLGKLISGHQFIGDAEMYLQHKQKGRISLGGEGFSSGNDFNGTKAKAQINLQNKGARADITGSILQTNGIIESQFIRHKSDILLPWKFMRFGFRDEREDNKQFVSGTDSLSATSYGFYDWEARVGTADSIGNSLTLFYRDRIDLRPSNNSFDGSARAEQYGVETLIRGARKNQLKITASNRKLRALNSELFTQEPENTLLGRVEYTFRFWSGFLTGNTFYEIGSGLEQQREFVYLQVQPGQGIYIWNDYNGDGVKDLNEFEIAQFTYEADYIRVFLQSDDYARIYTNQWTQNINLEPAKLWKNPTGVKKFISRFTNQASFKTDRKTSREDEESRFNPILNDIADTVLLALNSSFRTILFFNKINPVFGLDFTYQDLSNKTLLANGFESRADTYKQLGMRWAFLRHISLLPSVRTGAKSVASDFLTGRNFRIEYLQIKPQLTWQPDYNRRVSLLSNFTKRKNTLGIEKSTVAEIGIEAQLNTAQQGTFSANFSYLNIAFNEESNSSLGFEMLEGLSIGNNFTWGINLQRNITKNLQLNFTYNGRKPGDFRIVHSGGVQARAIF
jgi:hypothetical protein